MCTEHTTNPSGRIRNTYATVRVVQRAVGPCALPSGRTMYMYTRVHKKIAVQSGQRDSADFPHRIGRRKKPTCLCVNITTRERPEECAIGEEPDVGGHGVRPIRHSETAHRRTAGHDCRLGRLVRLSSGARTRAADSRPARFRVSKGTVISNAS